ncbi:MAG: hypothetical protein JWM83_2030 [Candidatus Angelobacter sp.]|jgi:hypothetical protein|nr:hypothetical protein [Candidatus Angelobacter sp.]
MDRDPIFGSIARHLLLVYKGVMREDLTSQNSCLEGFYGIRFDL